MYKDNNRKVTIVCFSMGCPVSHHFLTRTGLTQAWKDTYIHGYMTVVGAWGGGVVALQALISGSEMGQKWPFNVIAEYFTADIARSMESLYWLMPRQPIWEGETVVSTPHYEYSADDYKQLFSALPEKKFGNAYKKFEQAISLGRDFPAPNVRTFCMYSIGDDPNTPERLEYRKDFNNDWDPTGVAPKVTMGWGDGIVNEKNAKVCLEWKDMPQGFEYHVCRGFPHIKGCGTDTMRLVQNFAKIKTHSKSKDVKENLLEKAFKESIMEMLDEENASENEIEKMFKKLME